MKITELESEVKHLAGAGCSHATKAAEWRLREAIGRRERKASAKVGVHWGDPDFDHLHAMDINAISARVIILATKPSPGLNSARKGTPKISATSPTSIVDSNRELFLPFYRQKYADFSRFMNLPPNPTPLLANPAFGVSTRAQVSASPWFPFAPMTATSGATIVTLAALATTAALRLILATRQSGAARFVVLKRFVPSLRVQLPLSRHYCKFN